MTNVIPRMAGTGLTILLLLLGGLAAQEAATARPRPKARSHDRAQAPAEKATTPEKTEKTEKAGEKGKAQEKDKPRPGPEAEAEPVVTHHRIKVGDSEIKYTATAGLMPILDARGEPEARIFFMAYTREDAGPSASRPLLFSFNGGPGSSSVWLHMGALGPRCHQTRKTGS